jgi:hypothetical protein
MAGVLGLSFAIEPPQRPDGRVRWFSQPIHFGLKVEKEIEYGT